MTVFPAHGALFGFGAGCISPVVRGVIAARNTAANTGWERYASAALKIMTEWRAFFRSTNGTNTRFGASGVYPVVFMNYYNHERVKKVAKK